MQGVATEVVGNCGMSPSPAADSGLDLLEKYTSPILGAPPAPGREEPSMTTLETISVTSVLLPQWVLEGWN